LKRYSLILFFLPFFLLRISQAQTVPNGDFETWTSHSHYDDPQYWDTPNQEVCTILTGYTNVVSKSTDHQSGSFSVKLETKNIPFFNVVIPGVITLGTLTIDILNLTYSITGGVPITIPVTHLKGFYKFIPKGGDSCAVGIGLTQWHDGMRDSVGLGYFSTHSTVSTWTPFSAWINIDSLATPDTMNILAISSAMSNPTAGTVLYLDGLYLDYAVGTKDERPSAGIEIYQDRELKELLVFLDFSSDQSTSLKLLNMMGQTVVDIPSELRKKEKISVHYDHLDRGIYILEIIHNNKKFSRKFILNP